MRLPVFNEPERAIFALASAAEARDAYTGTHPKRVANTALHLGMRLGLPESDLLALYRGGLVRDIGKMFVPDAILRKSGPLNAAEEREMRAHPVIGERIVKRLSSAADLLSAFVITMSDSTAVVTQTDCAGTGFLSWHELCRSATRMTRWPATGLIGPAAIPRKQSRL